MASLLGVELSLNGNSGNPSTSPSLTPSEASSVLGGASNFIVHAVQPGSNGMAPTQSGSQGGTSEKDTGVAALDLYRNHDRKIEEAEVDKPASIRITTVGPNHKNIISAYSNFMLQAVSESEQEKYQVVETFTAYYAFFYGKRPPVYNYSGMLLNDEKQGWANSFKDMYERYFRGTKTAELGAQVFLSYGNKVVSGFILNLSMQEDAMNPNGIPFSFSMLVIDYTILKFSDDYNTFLNTLQKNMAAMKEKADQDIKQLNQTPDSLQNIIKNQVLNGLRSIVFAAKSVKKEDTTSKKVKTETERKDAMVNQAINASPSPISEIEKNIAGQ